MQPPSIAPVLADLNAAAERIWEACSPRWPTLSLDVLPEVGSTNTELMDRGRRGETWPTALVAASQTAGRGRRGRSWAAQPGDTLTCSLGLPLQLDEVPGGGSALSLAVGLSLAQSLDRAPQARHASGQGPGLPGGRRWVVIGFGLNVRPGQAPAGSAWLARDGDDRLGVGEVWSWLLPDLLQAGGPLPTSCFAPPPPARPGQVPDAQPPPDASGTAQGVDESGALLVHTAFGPQRWSSGEVSVRPASSADPSSTSPPRPARPR